MTSLRLAVVQFSAQFGETEANIASLEALLEPVEADIIVLPELCTTGYFFQSRDEAAQYAETVDGPSCNLFRRTAAAKNAVVVGGFAERAGAQIFNSCALIAPEDAEVQVYRKIHLFYREKFAFDVGDKPWFNVYNAARDVNIGMMVCYDWRFPEAARSLMLAGADLVVCPSNLVTEAWRKVMPARAIENKVYMAVANRAGTETRGDETLVFKGDSAVYGYNGDELALADPQSNIVIYADILPAKTRDKSFNAFNDVRRDRVPSAYAALCRPNEAQV